MQSRWSSACFLQMLLRPTPFDRVWHIQQPYIWLQSDGCPNSEHYICSRPNCQTRIYKSCFSKHLPSTETFLDLPVTYCGHNQYSSVPYSVAGLDDNKNSHELCGMPNSPLDPGEEIISTNERSENSMSWSDKELSIAS